MADPFHLRILRGKDQRERKRMSDIFHRVQSQLAQDPGQRGVQHLAVEGDLRAAAESLVRAHHVLIVTGFYIPRAKACETDGPPGARALGAAFSKLNIRHTYVTDQLCYPVCEAAGLRPIVAFEDTSLQDLAPSHLLAIERPGKAADGRYYSMRAMDITPTTASIDDWFEQAAKQGIPTIGIGDGGNEIGMGKVRNQVLQHVSHGATIACVTATNFLIAAGTSNFGAWGLVAAMQVLTGQQLLPGEDLARKHLEDCARAGAVDGVTGEGFILSQSGSLKPISVDGLEWETQAKFLREIHSLVSSP